MNERREKTEPEQIEFFERSYERFLQANASAGEDSHFFRVGGTIVRLSFAGGALVPYITPALEHLRVPPADPDLTLCIWDSRSTSVDMAPPPCGRENFTDHGNVLGFNSSRIKFAFHWSDYSVDLLDRSTRRGIHWVPDAGSLPYWALAHPLRTLFHWWMQHEGCHVVHAAAVGTDDGAVLLTGKGGMGKSTAALSSLLAGLYYLGDDTAVVRLTPEPVVYSLYCVAELHAEAAASFPALAALVRSPEKAGRDKRVMLLYPQFKRQIAAEMRLKAIVLPHRAGLSETRITPAPSEKAFRALTSISELDLPHVGPGTRDFMSRLCSAVPSYTLDMTRDRNATPRAIANLLIRPPHAAPAHHRHAHNGTESAPTPLVSIIAVVFNAEHDIRSAIARALLQDYPALELIVVDDGSTDRTPEIVPELPYDIRCFRQEHAGPACARNRGIREATGEFLAFLDVRGVWPDNTLTRLVNELRGDPEADVVYGDAQLASQNHATGDYEPIGDRTGHASFRATAAVFRKSAFSKAGLFDGTATSATDNAWHVRAAHSGVHLRRVDEITLLVAKPDVDVRRLKKTLDQKRAQEARVQGG